MNFTVAFVTSIYTLPFNGTFYKFQIECFCQACHNLTFTTKLKNILVQVVLSKKIRLALIEKLWNWNCHQRKKRPNYFEQESNNFSHKRERVKEVKPKVPVDFHQGHHGLNVPNKHDVYFRIGFFNFLSKKGRTQLFSTRVLPFLPQEKEDQRNKPKDPAVFCQKNHYLKKLLT